MMSKYQYEFEEDGEPSGRKETVIADYFQKEFNQKSGLYEYVFYENGVQTLIVPAIFVVGEPIQVA